MIIEGTGNSSLRVVKHEEYNKYLVMVTKQVSEGFHKSVKLVVDNVHSYSEGSHSIEISGVHYAVTPELDFFPMASRIVKSRSYRRYKTEVQVQAAA
jgi:hypothetical protein